MSHKQPVKWFFFAFFLFLCMSYEKWSNTTKKQRCEKFQKGRRKCFLKLKKKLCVKFWWIYNEFSMFFFCFQEFFSCFIRLRLMLLHINIKVSTKTVLIMNEPTLMWNDESQIRALYTSLWTSSAWENMTLIMNESYEFDEQNRNKLQVRMNSFPSTNFMQLPSQGIVSSAIFFSTKLCIISLYFFHNDVKSNCHAEINTPATVTILRTNNMKP
jgi:hypothetical protein